MQQNTGKSLRENLLQSTRELLLGRRFIYQQDKPPQNKGKATLEIPKSSILSHMCGLACFSHMAPLKLDGLSIRMERNCSECPYVQR